jgi:site-specific DNA recombinase
VSHPVSHPRDEMGHCTRPRVLPVPVSHFTRVPFYDSVANEIYRLRELRQETLASNAERQNKRQRIAEMMEFLESQSGVIFEYDEKLVRLLIERVTVFNNTLTVKFRSGIEPDIKISV